MAIFDFSMLNSFGPIIPFLFMLAVVYGGLEIASVFKNRAVNAIIAIAIAFMAMMSPLVVDFIYVIIPYAAILFIVFFLIAIVMKPFKGKGGEGPSKEFLIIIVILVLLFLITMSQPDSPLYGMFQFGPLASENLMWLIGMVAIILIFYFAYKHK